MNLRILKKLCKRAAPLLPLLGDKRGQFKCEKGDGCIGLKTKHYDRKNWERMSVNHEGKPYRGIKFKAKSGKHWVIIFPPTNPLKGTIVVGSMCGYEEPEWEEETAWGALRGVVAERFCDIKYNQITDKFEYKRTRDLRSIASVFKAANDLILSGQKP